ncbi:MAG: DUF445 domain-containing protein [Geitlerinemataceae cyanobacterium]
MNLNWAEIWIYFLPPVAGGLIGYGTNDIAIKMLFRPYRAYYIGSFRIPFTPGLIPRNQNRLAQRVADTIVTSLLTPEELQKLTRRLLAIERVQAAILWLLQSARDRLKIDDPDSKAVRVVSAILRDLLSESLPRLLRVWSRNPEFLAAQSDRIFDRFLLEYRLSQTQAEQLTDWMLSTILSPNSVRLFLVDFLTDRTINAIDASFRQGSSGTYWLVANIVGLRALLIRLRTFCLDNRQEANIRLGETIEALELRDRLCEELQNLSLQNLALSTVRQLRRTLRRSVRRYVQNEGAELIGSLGESVDIDRITASLLGRLRSSELLDGPLEAVSEELAQILDRYLEEDLERLVARTIPILALDRVIIDRVNATSAENLERATEGIVKTELQSIVNLGGVLGIVIGLLQTATLFLRP